MFCCWNAINVVSFKESARKFGIKIYKEKFFVNNNDPRVRDKNNLLFTEDSKHMEAFFLTHKLMPQLDTLSEWVECEDGGYVRKTM